jgi:hypothetical protein
MKLELIYFMTIVLSVLIKFELKLAAVTIVCLEFVLEDGLTFQIEICETVLASL